MNNSKKYYDLLDRLGGGMADLLQTLTMSVQYYDSFDEFKATAGGATWVSFENQTYKIEITPK